MSSRIVDQALSPIMSSEDLSHQHVRPVMSMLRDCLVVSQTHQSATQVVVGHLPCSACGIAVHLPDLSALKPDPEGEARKQVSRQ